MTKSADLQRLASLSDCVFAVAMTLLTFSVRIPDHGVEPAKLPGEFTRMWNESFGLVLSFAIAAMMWVYASRTGLIEPGTLTHPIAVESIVPVFPY
jgi:uncharacterized membrane protein